MKHLSDFIFSFKDQKLSKFLIEHFINESSFDRPDWENQNHTYAQDVINVLINGEPIKLGDKGEEGEYIATKDEINLLKKLTPDYTQVTLNQFNKIFSGKIRWTKIYKGDFSGHGSKSSGQLYESLVCYIFNGGRHYQEWADFVGIKTLDKSWINSCELTVDFINKQQWARQKWNRHNYIACHVDGNDFDFDHKYEFALNVAKIFKDKKEASKLMGVDCNDLYTGGKDTWNKADIILVKKDCYDVIQSMKEVVSNGESLNAELCCKLMEGIIIPISLKKVVKKEDIHLTTANIDEAEESKGYIFKDVDIRISSKYDDNTYVGNIDLLCSTLDNEEKDITFRKNTNAGNGLNVETQDKNSRGGKALANIKSALKIGKGNEYYIVKNTDEEALDELEKYGFDINIPRKSNYDKVNPPIRERACVAGLLGLLEQYRNKKHPKVDKDFITDFAKFCYICSIKGTGSFFKIS